MCSIRDFVKTFEINAQAASNDAWYDWFCRDSSLLGKTKGLAPTVKKLYYGLLDEGVDIGDWTVFFKNCCPCNGPLYDRIGFYRPDEKENFCIDIKCCWNDHAYVVDNWKGFGEEIKPIIAENSRKDMVAKLINFIKEL